MRRLGAIAAAVTLLACGSAVDDEPMPVPPPAAAPAPDPRIAEMQILLAELLDRIEVMNARLGRLEQGVPAAPPAEAPSPTAAPARSRAAAPPSPAVLGDAYREALILFGQGRIDDARAAFQQIFESDPEGDLADNALYWIGETWFVQGRHHDAIEVYRRLVDQYGERNKAPDAMLKTGLAYARLGDLAMARTTLESLTKRYPYSTPAATARHELERIRY